MSIDAIRDRIRRGATVHMGFADGERVWWFENPYQPVSDRAMRKAAVSDNGQALLEEAGDSLFGWEGNSQTWRSVFA